MAVVQIPKQGLLRPAALFAVLRNESPQKAADETFVFVCGHLSTSAEKN
jgi:hypothetical protein